MPKESIRFGIGEWYGSRFHALEDNQRLVYSTIESKPVCPFKHPDLVTPGGSDKCTKSGGVCSLRLYKLDEGEAVRIVEGAAGSLRATCPYRFYQDRVLINWIGSTILGTQEPILVTEVGFLETIKQVLATRVGGKDEGTDQKLKEEMELGTGEDVGRLDMVLLHPDSLKGDIKWCAVEIQAVYFSGKKMGSYINLVRENLGEMVFPDHVRRPDYRSSGPKRLMPQLQIKVPTLRRWGKKMGVVIDRAFYNSLGPMDEVGELSNCDIAWFVMDYDEEGEGLAAKLIPGEVHFTTLERAVEGLTGGNPVSQSEFERRIRQKIEARNKAVKKAVERQSKPQARNV